MGNWTDANLRNHVKGDQTYSFEKFFTTVTFVDNPSKRFLPFKLKNMRRPNNLIFKVLDFAKFNKEIDKLRDRSPTYRFDTKSDNKPMQDSFYSIGHVYLFQILLAINKKWNLLEYNSDKLPLVKCPTKRGLQDMFISLLKAKHYHPVIKLKTPEEIQKAIENLIINIDDDFGIADIVSEKYHDIDNLKQYIKRLKSPLVTKYLSRKLSSIEYDSDTINNELLSNTLNNVLEALNLYIK